MLTDENVYQFQKNGYTVLFNALEQNKVELFHNEADELANYLMSEGYDLVTDLGCIIEPWTCGYLDTPKDYRTNPVEYRRQRDSIMSDTRISNVILDSCALWASQLLNSKDIFLLNEQYIIKPPQTQSDFAWHRDSDYHHDAQVKSSVACWIALDDMNASNGTLVLEDQTLLQVSAGSIVFMTSQLLHKSTGNSSGLFRRAFMPQFSTIPLTENRLALAVPCLDTIL